MQQIFAWLASTEFAHAVNGSMWITAGLSATHLIGFTLVLSGALIWNLRAAGLSLADLPAQSIARPALYLLGAGLAISLLTGAAMFAPRAPDVAMNSAFQLKIGLLLVAAIYQLSLNATVLRRPASSTGWLRLNGVLGLSLWLSLAASACWFILFE